MEKKVNFEENLKYHRRKNGFTQKQLAQLLGYTEKSVSKWEKGGAMPTAELLLKLSDIFNVSLDELIYAQNDRNFFLGIDGGGTKTVFKLADENGETVNTVMKGAVNPNDIGMDASQALLKEGIYEVCRGIPFSHVTMFAGIAGGGLTGNNAAVLNGFFSKFGFNAFENGSDIENLVALATEDKCILVIMGTGFIVYALNGKERKRIGGWGQFFDDGGSGYTLGRDAVSAVLNAFDGSGEKTALTELFISETGQSAEEHLAKFYEGGKKYIAGFSALVFEAAKQKDAVAVKILEKNAEYVACRIKAAVEFLCEDERQNVPVLFAGGISRESGVLFSLIEKYLPHGLCRLEQIATDVADGAVLRARAIFEEKNRE
ncbi:MAG: XRE family transcriptional regulator [Clostridia bacterium]|nr:XRE family transcriptional regulator [Clostridia bacterium]